MIEPAYGNAPVTPKVERLWHLYIVHAEVGNGGLWQAHFNLDQDFIDVAGQTLRDIGATRHDELLTRAAEFLGPLPRNGEARQAAVDRTDPGELVALDAQWWEGDVLPQVVERHIRTHAPELLPPST